MTEERIKEARALPEAFRKVQLEESRYLEEDALTELDAVGYWAVMLAQKLADALEAPVQAVEAKLPAVPAVTLAGRAGARSAEHWDYAGVGLVAQDDGRTLKVLPLRGDGQ